MFFVLSKILKYLLAPLVWIAILIIVSFFIKNKIKRKKVRIAALILLVFFTNAFFQDEFMRLWEVEAVKTEQIDTVYDYGIVLAGMITYDAKYDRINFLRSADRVLQTISLYRQGIISNIFIVGGSGSLLDQKTKESIILRDYLIELGIPSDDIIIEYESRNTYENAVNAAKILKPCQNNHNYLLITSAFHMRRSAACFKKQGFEFDVFVADRYAGPRKFTPAHLLIPNSGALERWTLLIHEVSGFIIYKVVGYS